MMIKTGLVAGYIAASYNGDKRSTMLIGVLTLTFFLPGCRSLKAKRQRMGGLLERFGRNPAVAVCESGELNRHDASEWSLVIVATCKHDIDASSGQIEEKIQRVA